MPRSVEQIRPFVIQVLSLGMTIPLMVNRVPEVMIISIELRGSLYSLQQLTIPFHHEALDRHDLPIIDQYSHRLL